MSELHVHSGISDIHLSRLIPNAANLLLFLKIEEPQDAELLHFVPIWTNLFLNLLSLSWLRPSLHRERNNYIRTDLRYVFLQEDGGDLMKPLFNIDPVSKLHSSPSHLGQKLDQTGPKWKIFWNFMIIFGILADHFPKYLLNSSSRLLLKLTYYVRKVNLQLITLPIPTSCL